MASELRNDHGALRRTVTLLALAAAILLPAGAARATGQVLYAMENNDAVNEFSLTFPDLGITTTSKIVATRYTLEVDIDGTARFTDYYQLVEPLSLPLGISTGALTIRIKSSDGTYDPGTSAITTRDQYEISFTNDLSAFNFDSPVVIDGSASGILKNSVADARLMNFSWQGSGSIPNTTTPSEPYKYTYTCTTSTRFGSPDTFPPIPSVSANLCGAGTCGSTGGLAMVPLMFGMAAMKIRLRGRRRR